MGHTTHETKERSFASGAITVKAAGDDHYTLAGYGVVFAPDGGALDLHGERFTKHTNFWLDRPPDGMPVLYEHGQDPQLDQEPIGVVKAITPDETGLWFELQIAKAHSYAARIKELADRGLLGLSTGALGHLTKRNGPEITSWPLGEISLTVQPAEPQTIGAYVKTLQQKGAPTMGAKSEQIEQKNEEQQPTTTATEAQQQPEAGAPESSPKPGSDTKAISDRLDQIERLLSRAPAQRGVIAGDTSTRESDAQERYIKASIEYMRTGENGPMRKAERDYKAAMEIGTPSEGGYLVPETWSTEIVRAMNDVAILRANGARVLTARNTKSFHVPTLSDSAAAVLTEEEGAYTQGEPTVGEVEFVPYKYTKLAKVSEELAEDSPFDIMSQVLIPDWAQAFAAAENTATATGNGTGAPQGLISGATNTTNTATADVFVPEDIITLYHKLDHNYRQRAVWLMDDQTARVIRTFREAVYDGTTTTTGGQFLWSPGLREGEPDRLLGKPVITFNAMTGLTGQTGQNTGDRFLAFCDLSYYWIVDFGAPYMRRLDELYAGNGQVGFRAYKRMDANIMLQEAIQVMTIG